MATPAKDLARQYPAGRERCALCHQRRPLATSAYRPRDSMRARRGRCGSATLTRVTLTQRSTAPRAKDGCGFDRFARTVPMHELRPVLEVAGPGARVQTACARTHPGSGRTLGHRPG